MNDESTEFKDNKKTMHKKAQTAIEFMVLVGVLLFFFTIFFLVIQESSADKMREQQDNLVRETALAIQDEIALASKSSEGYSREFKVPDKIGNQDYSVSLIEDRIYIKTHDNKSAIALPIQKITGSIVKGENTIKKQNSELSIN